MALLGMVFALGAEQAAAQATLTNGTLEIEAADPDEGGATTVTVTLSAEVPANSPTATPVNVQVEGAARDGDATPAEDGDWTITNPASNTDATTATLEFEFPVNNTNNSVRHTLTETVMLQTRNHDADAEDEDLMLTATLGSPAGGLSGLEDVLDLTIDDDETQTYVLALAPATQEPMEGGGAVAVSVKAMPAHVQGSKQLTLNLDMPAPVYDFTIAGETGAVSTDGDSVTLGDVSEDDADATEAENMASITVTHPANDGNRVDTTLTLSAYSGQPGSAVMENALPIVLKDRHQLPTITATLTDANGMAVTDGMLTEGMTYMLSLSAPEAVIEDIEVTLTASGTATSTDDYSLGSNVFTIPTGQTSSAAVNLEVDLNDDIENDTLMFSGVVNGDDASHGEPQPGLNPMDLLSLTIVDATSKLVWPASGAEAAIEAAMTAAMGGDGQFNVGRIDIAKAALFDSAAGYAVQIAGATSAPAVATVYDGDNAANYTPLVGNMVIVPRSTGKAMITFTGSAAPVSSGAVANYSDGNRSFDVAEITFDVTVELAAPGMPRNLRVATPAGDRQVTLLWDAPSSGGAVAKYQYREAATSEWTDTTATTAMVTGLDNGTRYVFYVRAVNDAGNSAEATVEATPMATPVDASQVVMVKEVSAATSVAESGGLEVTVTATVPAGTKGADDKVAPIASKQLMVSFPTNDASLQAGEDADAGELTALGATNGYMYTWEKIARTEKASEATYKFRVAVGQDLDAEDEKFQVMVSIDGDGKRSKVVTIDDAQEQTYVLSLPVAAKGAITEGKSAKLTLEAKPKRTIDIPVTLALEPNDPSRYTLSAANGTFGTTSLETTVSTKADSNRADDTLTVTGYTDRHGEFASLDITVKDANALPAVKATLVDKDGKALDPQPESVMEGETVKVMLTAVDKDGKAMKAAEKLTITLMPTGTADAQDYRLSPQSFEIASGKESSAAVDLMVTEDQDIGEETLMFDAAVAGEAKNGTEKRSLAGVLSLMITDGTQKLVWANSQEDVEAAVYTAKNAGAGDDMTLTAGEMIEVMGAFLFSSAEGVTVSYTAASDMSDVASVSVSGGAVMVTAAAEGMAHITITAHASMPSGVKILDQTDPGMASVMFPVEVGLEALSIVLSGPEDMNLAEGMSAMVTATANRAVTADTTVMLMRDREMSSAGDADFSVEAITIKAGAMSDSTMVMAVEDNMAEDMEELVLYGMTEGMAGDVTGEVKLYLWDAAVPALPVIAQLLLAAFLAVGGYRRYRRR